MRGHLQRGRGRLRSTPFVPCGDDGKAAPTTLQRQRRLHAPAAPGGTVCRAGRAMRRRRELPRGGAPCPADGVLPNNTAVATSARPMARVRAGSAPAGGRSCATTTTSATDSRPASRSPDACRAPRSIASTRTRVPPTVLSHQRMQQPRAPERRTLQRRSLCTIIDVCQNGVCEGEDLAFLARSSARVSQQSVVDGHLAVNETGGTAKLGSFSTMTAGSLITGRRLGVSRQGRDGVRRRGEPVSRAVGDDQRDGRSGARSRSCRPSAPRPAARAADRTCSWTSAR